MSFSNDLRLVLRGLSRSPGFTLVVVATLALGIGASTAIWSVIDGVLLSELSFESADRVVTVWGADSNFGQIPISTGDFKDIREMSTAFEQFSARWSQTNSLTGDFEPEEITTELVTPNYFDLLGVTPGMGRLFEAEEQDAVVLSHGLWVRRFGSDPAILGQRIRLAGDPFTVVGVMPADVNPNLPALRHRRETNDLWRVMPAQWIADPDRINGWLRVVGLLKPDATLEQARAEMAQIANHIMKVSPDNAHVDFELHVTPVLEDLVRPARPLLLTLLGAVGFVLLICCFNVANLLLVRGQGRAREMAVRSALGAGRLQLVRQVSLESLVLAALGGIVGVLIAYSSTSLLLALRPPNLPRLETIEIDNSVLLFSLLATLVAALVFGLAPALRIATVDPARWLTGRGSEDAGHHRLSRTFVVVEVALSLVLLIGTGLLLQSFLELRRIRPGFDTTQILTASLTESGRSESREEVVAFFHQVEDAIAALPGVEAVGFANRMPLAGGVYAGPWATEEMKARGQNDHEAAFRFVTPSYFEAMGTALLAGRIFRREEDWRVAIVDERFAFKAWPGEDPIGKRVWTGTLGRGDDWSEVIGVVEHQRHASLIEDYNETLFFPNMNLFPGAQRYLAVRTEGDAAAVAPAVRAALREIDPATTLARVRPINALVSLARAQHRFALILVSIFALIAIVLALLGLYGVISYAVSQRTHEIGIRLAFGAGRSRILGLVLRQGLSLIGVGVLLGLAGSWGLTRFLSSLLVGVRPFELSVIATVVALLVGAGLLGTLIPARRAVRIDPIAALRQD